MNATAPSKFDHASFPGQGYQQALARGAALADGLRKLAARYSVTLQERLHINSQGEIDIVTVGGAPYGEAFAAILTKHKARTGFPGPNLLHAGDNWCMMNHFNVARMLEDAQV